MGNLGFDAFPGFMGVSAAIALSNFGAAYGIAKSGVGVVGMGQRKPQLIVKNLLPIIMASILGIYGMIVAVIIIKGIDINNYDYQKGYKHMAAGLSCGFCSLAAGVAIGIVGDKGARAVAQNEKIFVGMLLILIFAEAIGLFGMIVAIIVAS